MTSHTENHHASDGGEKLPVENASVFECGPLPTVLPVLARKNPRKSVAEDGDKLAGLNRRGDPVFRIHAQAYTANRFLIFPCVAGKKTPTSLGGFPIATQDPSTVKEWGQNLPYANIGLRTGREAGFLVVDTDYKPEKGKDGEAELAKLEAQHGKLPPTATVRSPGRGLHRYFQYPVAFEIPCSSDTLAFGIDVRSNGGYIMAPGSETDIGEYRVVDARPFAALPEGWACLLARKSAIPRKRSKVRRASGGLLKVSGAPPLSPATQGGRNGVRSWLAASRRERVYLAAATVTILQAAEAISLDVVEGSQSSPFREDNKPSFSVYSNCRWFMDHATGQTGGVIEFLRLAFPGESSSAINGYLLDIYEGLPADERIHRSEERDETEVDDPDWTGTPESILFGHSLNCWRTPLIESLAAWRGWSVLNTRDLLSTGRVGFLGAGDVKDGIVFLVERRAYDGRLVPVSMHRRFLGRTSDAEACWRFEPCRRKAHPFVALNNSLRHIVITEGQWDAWTARLAYGADFDGTILGVRGVHGIGTLMKYWAPAAITAGARILIIGQNDEAGRRVTDPGNCNSLLNKLLAMRGDVRAKIPHSATGIKDLNDLWKANEGIPRDRAEAWFSQERNTLGDLL